MFRTLLALSTLLVGCEVATNPEPAKDPKSYVWVFQMPMVHATPGDTLPQPEYLFCADSLRKGVSCTFQGMQGTYEEAFDASYLDGKDSTVQWPHNEFWQPLFVGRK